MDKKLNIFISLLFLAVFLFPQEGVGLLAQAKKKPPVKQPDPPFKQAVDLYNKKDYPKALEIFKTITAEFPDSADAVFYMGSTFLNLAEYELGIASLKKAAVLDEKYNDSLKQLDYSSIPFNLFRLNYDGDELITKLANGIRVSGVAYMEKAAVAILNEIAYPVWNEPAEVLGFGVEAGGFYNPVSLNLGYYMGEIDLKKVKKRFALPPGLPEGGAGFDYKITVSSINVSVLYTPAVVLWGYVYPSVGGCFIMSSYKHGSFTKSNSGIGLSAELMVKYKNLFLKGGFKKAIDDKSFDNQLSLQLGFKINMFN